MKSVPDDKAGLSVKWRPFLSLCSPTAAMPSTSVPELTCAPMEGLTTVVFRRLHARFFGAADRYYLPFVTPTREPRFTDRQMRELAPQANAGIHAIPQLLTRSPQDFIWAARALSALGYTEVNLNLGCPAGTVTAKGKGSGFLQHPVELFHFFEEIFEADPSIGVSVKTRIGYSRVEEFDALAEIYARFPLKRLIVHPRLKTDLYRGDVRLEVLDQALAALPMPLGYNGDLITPEDIRKAHKRYAGAPGGLAEIMVGRALMADPALFRKMRGGKAASRSEILAFHQALFDGYAELFQSRKNALMRMKEYWFYQTCLFGDEGDGENLKKAASRLFRCKQIDAFEAAVRSFVDSFALRQDARCGWKKPL